MESIIPLGQREIHIGAFVPFLKDDRNGYYNAMKMAIDIINNRSDILQNYTLVLDVEDTAWVSVLHRFYQNSCEAFNVFLFFCENSAPKNLH